MLINVILLVVFAYVNGFSIRALKNPAILVLIVLLGVGLYYVECTYGIFENKIVGQGGSYGVRMNDTIVGYNIAFKNFFFGTGIVNDYSSAWSDVLLDGSRSNGLANFAAAAGIPITIFYLYRLYKHAHAYSERKFLYGVAFFAILVCMYNTQPIVLQTMGLTFFFDWQKENKLEK